MEIRYKTDNNIIGIVEYDKVPIGEKICVDKNILKHILDACHEDTVTLEIIKNESGNRVLGIKSGINQNPELIPVVAEIFVFEESDEFIENLLGDDFFGFKPKEM